MILPLFDIYLFNIFCYLTLVIFLGLIIMEHYKN